MSQSETTVFDKIIARQLPAEIVYENEKVMAFKDMYPQAAIHILFIHKSKTRNIYELTESKPEQLQEIFSAIADYVKKEHLEENGFRVVSNTGKHGGQTVFYTHLHLLAGEPLGNFGR